MANWAVALAMTAVIRRAHRTKSDVMRPARQSARRGACRDLGPHNTARYCRAKSSRAGSGRWRACGWMER